MEFPEALGQVLQKRLAEVALRQDITRAHRAAVAHNLKAAAKQLLAQPACAMLDGDTSGLVASNSDPEKMYRVYLDVSSRKACGCMEVNRCAAWFHFDGQEPRMTCRHTECLALLREAQTLMFRTARQMAGDNHIQEDVDLLWG